MDKRVVIAVAGTALATWGVNEAWNSFGWTTPEQHNADIAQIEHLHDDIKVLTGHWDCYNLSVDITALLEIQEPTARQVEDLRQLRAKSDALGCSPP